MVLSILRPEEDAEGDERDEEAFKFIAVKKLHPAEHRDDVECVLAVSPYIHRTD